MSLNGFILFLQELLTMVDKKNPCSVALTKSILISTVELAIASQKVDPLTAQVMETATFIIDRLIEHSSEYAGKPGDMKGNEQKRRKLQIELRPGC